MISLASGWVVHRPCFNLARPDSNGHPGAYRALQTGCMMTAKRDSEMEIHSCRREVLMNGPFSRGVAAAALMSLTATLAFPQTRGPEGGPQTPVGSLAGRDTGGAGGNGGAEPCTRSPICAWGRGRNVIAHEERTPDMGFTFAYPFALPEGLAGGVAAVA